jgi:serine/threonine protein kinase
LHRDISIGNVLISEDETEGFLIDLDHAIRVDRAENSGARGRTGTKVFMSIGLLLQGDNPDREPHSFMDDLESMFWLLFWICVHYSGPGGRGFEKSTDYEEWNFRSPKKLGDEKAGLVGKELDFLRRITDDFTDYFAPLVPWVNQLRHEVFPGGFRWSEQDLTLYDRMKDVLEKAMRDPGVSAEWPDVAETRQTHRYQTRSKGAGDNT